MKKAKFWKVGHFHKSNFTHYLVYGCELSTYPDTIACNNDTAAAINTGVSDVKKVDCPDCLKLIKGDRMKKKVHLMIDGVGGCCNSYLYNTAKTIEAFNDFIVAGDDLVCKHCLNSALYISNRPLEKDEFDTQKAFNKSLEKERDSEPVEEPFNKPVKVVLTGDDAIKYIKSKEPSSVKLDTLTWMHNKIAKTNYKPEDVAFKPLNHSEHYEKQEGLESIEKMELIACHGIPKMYHQKIKSNLNLALAVKYHDRLGKKDETEKEIDKMKNYMNRSVKGEWRG